MKLTAINAIGSIFFWVTLALPVYGQRVGGVQVNPQLDRSTANAQALANGEVVREINDPQTGRRWLLMRDPSKNGGPGRLVPVPASSKDARPGETVPTHFPTSAQAASPVIHAGDHVILEENTAVVEARLEAVALGPALNGSLLSVRLVLGGYVIRAVALGPGRAAVASGNGARP